MDSMALSWIWIMNMVGTVSKDDEAEREEVRDNTRIKDWMRNYEGQSCINEKVKYENMITKSCAWIDYYMVQNITK